MFKYGDKVRVKVGFYKDLRGTLIGHEEIPGEGDYYEVEIEEFDDIITTKFTERFREELLENEKRKKKIFEIERRILAEYDDEITDKEIEDMLNKVESEKGYTTNTAKWTVKEI